MPGDSELNQLRRYIGDYGVGNISDDELTKLLSDTCSELTADFATPVIVFDTLVNQYRPEVILKSAINWWWDQLSKLQDKHSVSVGTAASNVSEKWQRAMEMIQWLEERYDEIQFLRTDISIGNFSRYSKQTLRRIGGIREEDTHA